MDSTKPVDQGTPAKRGPGRPPGSKNKPKDPEVQAAIDRAINKALIDSPPPVPPVNSAPSKPPPPPVSPVSSSIKRMSHSKDTPNAPDFTEWRDFIGEVVLHWFSVAFVAVMFRGIDYRNILTEQALEDIELDDEELAAVARPFAHLATHSGLNTKYGRAIMNSRDSIEAAVILFMWGSRVNRISRSVRNQLTEVESDIPRIPRPDRARDTSQEIDAESEANLPPIGIQQPAYGHGFN